MRESNLWVRAGQVKIRTAEGIAPGFDLGFDERIPQATREELRRFVDWVEGNFPVPVTLWVDFAYKHSLLSRRFRPVGYLFYWVDFATWPVFENPKHIPMVRLPVRTEKYTMEEVLTSFVEAITSYFAWICNEMVDGFEPDPEDVEEVLQAYRKFRGFC